MKPPLMIVKDSKRIKTIFKGLGSHLISLTPKIDTYLIESDYDGEPEEYASLSIFNSFLWAVFLTVVFTSLLFLREMSSVEIAVIGASIFFLTILMFLTVFLKYPAILAGKKSERVNRELVYALKDLKLKVQSGISLYNAMVAVSKAGYGEVSEEFSKTVREISSGKTFSKALEDMALRNSSDHFRKTIWQMLNTRKAGGSMVGSLETLIDDLEAKKHSKIKDYAEDLNIMALMYMMFAVVAPSIGLTLLVVVSSFSGIGVTPGLITAFLGVSFALQWALVGFIKAKRPKVRF